MAARFLRWCTREHQLIGSSLMRISLGVWAIFYYVLHWSVRHQLWGPDGFMPFDRFLAEAPVLNVFALSRSAGYFDAVYLAGMVIALLLTIGLWTRVMIPAHWLMIWSLQERNVLLGDGGDNVMRIVLLFLALTHAGACLSLDEAREATGGQSPNWVRRRLDILRASLRPFGAVAHNVGWLLIVAQLALVYTSTGLYKAMGEVWQNGTALYYILRVDEFSLPGVAEWIFRNPYLVVLGTYGTVLFEVMFLPALSNRWTRYAAIAIGICFHTGIALVMGLVTFAWSMLSIYPLLVSDAEYRQVGAWLRERWRVTAFFDGWCPLCTKSVRRLARFDLISLVRFVSFRDPGVTERYGIDPGRAARRMQVLASSGRVLEGIDAVTTIVWRLVPLWPSLPLLLAARLLGRQGAYDAVARRRLVLVPGPCEGHCQLGQWPSHPSAAAGRDARSESAEA